MNTKTPAAAGRLARDHVVLKRAAASEFLQICWTIECHGQCHTDRGRWLRGLTWARVFLRPCDSKLCAERSGPHS